MIHIPLKVTTVNNQAMVINTIGDLYNALGGANNVNFIITHDTSANVWRGYIGAQSKGAAADSTLTDDLGVITVMKNAVTLILNGNALGTGGTGTITLKPGINLVGVPLHDNSLGRVSDLLNLEGIKDNATAIIVSDEGTFKVVAQAGDAGDVAITGGQSFIITASAASTATVNGIAWGNAGPPNDESLKLIINEDFESFSAGTNKTELGDNWIVFSEKDWDYGVPNDIDDTVSASGNKSLKMRASGERQFGGTGVIFTQSSDVTIIECSLRIDNSVPDTDLLGFFAVREHDDNGVPIVPSGIGAAVVFSGNEIVANGVKTGKTYLLNTWVKIKMKTDTKNNKFTVWVNDEATSSATTNANLTSQGAITGFWLAFLDLIH